MSRTTVSYGAVALSDNSIWPTSTITAKEANETRVDNVYLLFQLRSYLRQCPNRPSDEGQSTLASTAFDRWPSSSNDMPRMDSPQIPNRNAELPRYLLLRRAGPMEAIPVGVLPGQVWGTTPLATSVGTTRHRRTGARPRASRRGRPSPWVSRVMPAPRTVCGGRVTS